MQLKHYNLTFGIVIFGLLTLSASQTVLADKASPAPKATSVKVVDVARSDDYIVSKINLLKDAQPVAATANQYTLGKVDADNNNEYYRIVALKAQEKQAAEKARLAKIAAANAKAAQLAQEKAQAQAAYQAKLAQQAEQQRLAQEQAATVEQTTSQATTPAYQGTGTGKVLTGWKISFYDPMVASGGATSIPYYAAAADRSILPQGTKLKITSSHGDVYYRTVLDTGSFIYDNPHQVDIAVHNSEVPSWGIDNNATIEILS